MKLTLNSKPMDGWQITWGLDADHERFTSNQMFFDLAQASASGGLNNKKIYTTGRYPSYDITNLAAFLQSGYDINNLFTSTVAYAISTLKTRLMISSATRSNGRLPPGRLHPPTPFLAAQSITTTSCSTPVC